MKESKIKKILKNLFSSWYSFCEERLCVIWKKWRPLSIRKTPDWYYVSSVCVLWIHYPLKIHKLVAYIKFWDEIFSSWNVVRHLNWDSLDNSFENILLWTQKENSMDRPKEQRVKEARHASSFNMKYDWDEVITMHKEWMSYSQIMRELWIKSKWTVSNIVKNFRRVTTINM